MDDIKTKKEFYNESDIDQRTYINNEIAIKPYYYYRNGLLHVRYNVDRCLRLTKEEACLLKQKLTTTPDEKQKILEEAWKEFYESGDKILILDGISELEKTIHELTEKHHKE